jgi:hypothetical protein
MSAPLPLRFHNPIKNLCVKVNLDYETVICTGLSAKMREAYVNADIEKPLEQIKSDDKKRVKHKIEFLNRKYGGSDSKTGVTEGEVEDKGAIRYNTGLTVEHLLPDDSKVDESKTSCDSVETNTIEQPFKYKRPSVKYYPGRGLINPNEE